MDFYKLDNKITLGQTEGYDYFPTKQEWMKILNSLNHPTISEISMPKDDIALISDPFLKDEILGGPTVLKIKFSIDQSDVDLFSNYSGSWLFRKYKRTSHPGKMRAPFMDNKNITQLSW